MNFKAMTKLQLELLIIETNNSIDTTFGPVDPGLLGVVAGAERELLRRLKRNWFWYGVGVMFGVSTVIGAADIGIGALKLKRKRRKFIA